MEDHIGSLFGQVLKKSSQYTWVVYLYLAIMTGVLFSVFIDKNFIMSFLAVDNKFELIKLLFQNIMFAVGVIFAIKLFSETSMSQSKRRVEFYTSCEEKVRTIFKARFSKNDETSKKNLGVFESIIFYENKYVKDDKVHIIDIKNIEFKVFAEVDTMYISYIINENESLYFSIWHSGDSIAIGLMVKKSVFDLTPIDENGFTNMLKGSLNISDTKNYNELSLNPRGEFYLIDFKYDVDQLFLKDQIKKEELSRKIAHVVTVGLPQFFKLMQWTCVTRQREAPLEKNFLKMVG